MCCTYVRMLYVLLTRYYTHCKSRSLNQGNILEIASIKKDAVGILDLISLYDLPHLANKEPKAGIMGNTLILKKSTQMSLIIRIFN